MAVYSPTGSGSVHVDQVLTNISVGWPNEGLVGDRLFPAVGVKKQSDKYYVHGREGWLPENDLRAPGSQAHEVPGMTVSTDTYYAQEHSLQIAVTDEERDNVDSPLAPDRDGTDMITSKVMLGREKSMKDLVTTAANYAAGLTTTLAGGAQWNVANYATSDPIQDVRTGVRAVHAQIFLEPNVMVIPYQVMSQLEDHPDFIERIKYSERAVLTREIIGGIFGIPNVIVPGLGFNSGVAGGTETLSYLWGKDVVLAYVPPRAGLKVPAFGYEFVWNGQTVERWREERRRSDILRVRRSYDMKFIAKDSNSKAIAGYLIKNAVA